MDGEVFMTIMKECYSEIHLNKILVYKFANHCIMFWFTLSQFLGIRVSSISYFYYFHKIKIPANTFWLTVPNIMFKWWHCENPMLLKMEGGEVLTSDKLQEVTGDVVIKFCKSLSVVQGRKMLLCICIGTPSQWICFSVLLYVDTSCLVACVFFTHTQNMLAEVQKQ